MKNMPEPESTPDGPAYEGRLLPRPDDEIVDQGAGFDIATLVSRRRVLTLVGAGVGAAALAACSTDSSTSTATTTSSSSSSATTTSSASSAAPAGEIPEETNGPYPADGTNDLNILEESGIVRSDITTSLGSTTPVAGVPLTFTFALTDMANGDVPFENAALYVWQCNAAGEYSMYTQGVEDETFLRGIQVADSNGELTFQTIIPGCYQGRWPHLHFEIYPDVDSATDVANAIATSQVAFPADILGDIYALDEYAGSAENLAGVGTQISDDSIFGDGDWELQVPTISGDITAGFIASLPVGVDTTTVPEEVTMGGGGGMPPGGGTPPDGGAMPPGGGQPPSGNPPSGMQPPN